MKTFKQFMAESCQLAELSANKLAKYINRATDSHGEARADMVLSDEQGEDDSFDNASTVADKRKRGIRLATAKIVRKTAEPFAPSGLCRVVKKK